MTTQPLGILRSGPCAAVDDRGVVTLVGVRWRLGWWVAGEDRWHRPDVDAAVRQRLIEDTPVVETSVRVPGGDAVGTTYAYASRGKPALAGRLANASPVPVAAAVVIGPARQVTVDGSTIVVDGHHVIEIGRRPSASTSAATLDALAERLPTVTAVAEEEMSGYVAVVVPLPHTQMVTWQVSAMGDDPTPAPEPEAVAGGWLRHSEEGAQIVVPGTEASAFARARHLVAMGVPVDSPVIDVATNVTAAVSLGWFDAALTGTDRLAAAQRGRGRIGDDERSTAAALAALASWRRAGIPADGLEHVVGPVLAGARWLVRRVDRVDRAGRDGIVEAIVAASLFLRSVDQRGAADQLDAEMTDRLGTVIDRTGVSSSLDPVTGLIEDLVDDRFDGLDLLAGWSRRWGPEPIEATDVPTPWGTMSFALRWHGARPALLWELEPWIDVTHSAPVLRSPVLDPAWQGSGWRGDALLAEQIWASTGSAAGESEAVDPTDGSFS